MLVTPLILYLVYLAARARAADAYWQERIKLVANAFNYLQTKNAGISSPALSSHVNE